jgi:hypothetical protein
MSLDGQDPELPENAAEAWREANPASILLRAIQERPHTRDPGLL